MSFFTIRALRPSLSAAAFLASSSLFTACLNETEDHHEEEYAWEHPCIHAAESPTAVTASSVDSLAPDVSAGHTHFGVAFTAGSGVKFVADEDAEFGFFLTKDVPVVLRDSAGDTLEFEETVTELTGCAELAVMHVADLSAGVHYLAFGTSAETSVGLVIEEQGHDHVHE